MELNVKLNNLGQKSGHGMQKLSDLPTFFFDDTFCVCIRAASSIRLHTRVDDNSTLKNWPPGL